MDATFGERCRACGRAMAARDVFCTGCGTARGPARRQDEQPWASGATPDAAAAERRRLGGTLYRAQAVTTTDPDGPGALAVPPFALPTPPSSPGKRRASRRHRRRWYRRPLLVVPLVLLVAAATVGAAVAWRAVSTVATLHEVSTPPPVVAISVDEEDEAGATVDEADTTVLGGDAPERLTVDVDTGPARAALVESGYVAAEGSGIVGRVRTAATDFGDMAEGAVVAAGVADPAAAPMTILVMGVDARPGEAIDIGVRPDVLMVLRLDPAAGACRLLSIPRDTRTELPGYGQSKVNHALALGGIPYQLLVVEQLLGVELDHYALINFEGFRDLVDAVGGITVAVPERVTVRGGIELTAGPQELDGETALAYARYRDPATNGDIGRIKRQWAILRGLGEAAQDRNLVRDVDGVLPAIEGHVRTDMSSADLATIARTYGGSCRVDTVAPALLGGTRVRLDDPILDQTVYYNLVDEARIREEVAILLGS